MLETAFKILTAISDLFVIVASGIAIYLFIAKKEVISSVIRVFLNFSFQITLVELKAKLERLNDLNADDSKQKGEVINILNEVVGQIRGNKFLSGKFEEVISKLSAIAEGKRQLTEPIKRSLVSELRERLRSVDVDNYLNLIGE